MTPPDRLRFGTAGLRGPYGDGPGRMNRDLASRAAAAVAGELLASVPGAATRGVAVGGDARHGSSEMVDETVSTLLAHGVDVHRFDEPVPTPLVSFATTHLGAAAGIVITASHNPAGDNGMKVFWSDGAQIVPPLDTAIGERIDRFGAPGPVPPPGVPRGRLRHLGATSPGGSVVEAYLERARGLLGTRRDGPPVRVAATALHGVGARLAQRAMRHVEDRLGGIECHWVAHQRDPDPDFPGLPVPNPEEPGVLDDVVELAGRVDADLALALDPDADRLAVAVPDGGSWRVLTGDELGVVLLAHLLERTAGRAERLVATTIVSSQLAARMCAAAGVHIEETLTGFKWLCRPGLAHPEWHQVLIYEEAMGYGIGPDARDKDGITAALVAIEAVGGWGDAGRTVPAVLDELAREHGAFVTANGSLRTTSTGHTAGTDPPNSLGGLRVRNVDRPAPDVLRLRLDGVRVLVRPSGTEPKVKYYVEGEQRCDGRDPSEARAAARRRIAPVVADLRGWLS